MEMRKKLAELRTALQELKRASMFKKALAAEVALMAALVLIEEMVEEIEKLKRGQGGTDG
jgi:tRNA(Ile2) C34 agmatinyltransferase TiaS